MRFSEIREMIVGECSAALKRIGDEESERFLDLIEASGQVFFVGVGRVLLSLQAICKRFAHLSVKTHYVGEITEPAMTPNDLLIVGSGSGESLFPVAIARKAKGIGVKITYIGSNPESAIAGLADLMVRIPVQTKLSRADELVSAQPMTTLFEQCLLLYGDALAKLYIERKKIRMPDLWMHHANLE